MPDFFDVALSQRAHRALRTDTVGDDLIERVLDAAIHAPSAENTQPWAFVVVRDPAVREGIATMVRTAWDGIQGWVRTILNDRFYAGVERWATVGFGEAPVLVVVCGDTQACGDESMLAASIFPATQNLLLAATALGLGSLISTLPLLGGAQLNELLALPPHLRPMAVVSLGWPARQLKKPTRIPFHAKSFRDRYGNPW